MQSNYSNQDYLRNQQYRDSSNLDARAALHQRFNTSTVGWHEWVFDQIDLPERARLLELGCGPAKLWLTNLDRIPAEWVITLSDFSPGMVETAQRLLVELAGIEPRETESARIRNMNRGDRRRFRCQLLPQPQRLEYAAAGIAKCSGALIEAGLRAAVRRMRFDERHRQRQAIQSCRQARASQAATDDDDVERSIGGTHRLTPQPSRPRSRPDPWARLP